eukprot:jgi/Tetstr1/441165/TSEL_029423.t1
MAATLSQSATSCGLGPVATTSVRRAASTVPLPAKTRGALALRSGANGLTGKALTSCPAKTSDSRSAMISKAVVSGFFNKSDNSKTKNKTVILTGASSGLGLATLKSLMTQGGHHVVCGVRDVEKMQTIVDGLGYPREAISIYQLELKSLDSVKAFVKKFRGSGRTLDVLCCNAAIYLPNQPKPTFAEYGFEESMAVNHLSHFLLINLMIRDLQKSKEPRCVIVGSITGNTNTVGGGAVAPHANLGNLQGLATKAVMADGHDYNGAKAYKDSKLANMMTMLELHRRYHEKTGIVFSSMYPGCIAETALFRQKRGWFRSFFPIFMKYVTGGYVSEDEAGDRLAAVITSPEANKSGVYWSWNGGARSTGWYNPAKGQVVGAGGAGGEMFENVPSAEVRNPRKAKKLWELSEKAVGLAN